MVIMDLVKSTKKKKKYTGNDSDRLVLTMLVVGFSLPHY